MQHWITIAIVASATVVLAEQPDLQLDMPKNVAYNEGLTGTCVAKNSLISPHVIVNKDFKSNCHIASRNKIQKGSTSQTTFELSDVNGTCVVRCLLFRARVEGTVIPVISREPKIISEPHNTTVHAGVPVSITCIVQRRDLLYNQLLWMKGDTFVGIDKDHSLSISQHDDNKRNYELIIHATVETTPYTCMLVSTNGNVVSSITQYVIVDEADQTVSDLLKYLEYFFKWNTSD